MKKELEIFSVGIHTADKNKMKAELEAALGSEKQKILFTPNPQMLLACRRSEELRNLMNKADFSLPDGIGIKLVSGLYGAALPERLSGIDMGEFVLSVAAKKGLSVFLLGGKPNVAQDAAKALSKKHEGLRICGAHHGYFEKSGEENSAVLDVIRQAAPHVLIVCFGFPIQEKWIAENLSSLPSVRLAMGLGGSLDVWSGNKKRAPSAFRKMGLEWLWRALAEPRRMKIFVDIPRFLACSIADAL